MIDFKQMLQKLDCKEEFSFDKKIRSLGLMKKEGESNLKLHEIIKVLNREVPPTYACDWDHVGLLVGDEDQEIRTVLVALDVTDAAVDQAIKMGADLIVTHHPLIFHALDRVTKDDFTGRRVRALIQHDISYFAMHTNFDIVKMADLNARELDLKDARVLETVGEDQGGEYGFGRIGQLKEPLTLAAFADRVKQQYRLPGIRVYGDPDRIIQTAAVASGSGKSSIPDAIQKGADVIVTGDADYHTAIDANAQGLALIDAGHYGTEFGFIFYTAQMMQDLFPDLDIKTAEIAQPYRIL